MSAFGGEADIKRYSEEVQLMTLSGHLAFIAFFTAPDGPWSSYLCDIVS